jgi:O-antigen/teichoic acid export membrane protein
MIKKNLIANYLGQGWTVLMSLAFVPVYIKYLGMESYGLIGLFALLQSFLVLLDLGMSPTLGREMARFTGGSHSNESILDLLRSIEIIAVAIAVVIAGGIALSADWIATDWLRAETLSTEVVSKAFVILGLVTALRFVENIYRSTLVGLQRQVLLNVVNGLMATLRSIGAIGILVWVSPTIGAFFLWQALVSITTLAILGIATYRCFPKGERSGRFSVDALKSVLRFAGGMMGVTLLALLLTQVDKVLLSKLLTLNEYGLYTLAATVAGGLYMLVGPITQAYYPKFCQFVAQGNTAALVTNYHQGAQLVSIVVGSAGIVLFFFAETLLRLWMHDAELAKRIAPLLSVLSLGTLLNTLMWIPYQTQLAYGWTRLAIWTNFVAVAVFVPAILWIVPQYGSVGAAWIWVCLNAGYCSISLQFMHRRILPKDKWRWYGHDVIAPLAAALLAAKILQWLWPGWQGSNSDLTLLVVAACATLSAATLASSEIRQLFFKLLKARLNGLSNAHGN